MSGPGDGPGDVPGGCPGGGDEPGSRPPACPPGRVTSGPFVDRCEARKYAWCRCERSATYPYCDGTHRGSDVTPLKVVFDKPCTVVWCACGRTGNPPYCDGTHSSI